MTRESIIDVPTLLYHRGYNFNRVNVYRRDLRRFHAILSRFDVYR